MGGTGCSDVAGTRCGLSETDEQVDPGAIALWGDGQCAPIEPHGLLVGRLLGSLMRRPTGVVDRPPKVRCRHGLDEVVGEHGVGRIRVVVVQDLKHVSDSEVQPLPLASGQCRVEHLPDERVLEAPWTTGPDGCDEHVGPCRLIEEIQRLAGRSHGKAHDLVERDIDADDRAAVEELAPIQGTGVSAGAR